MYIDKESPLFRIIGTILVTVGLPVLILILASGPILAQDEIIYRNYTPPAWKYDDIKWSRDVSPHNKIDDLIDMTKQDTFDIIINFGRCISDEDIDVVMSFPGSHYLQRRSKYLTSLLIGRADHALVDYFSTYYGVAFIESQGLAEPTLDVSLENIQVINGTGYYGANTVENAFPGIDGSGVNIVIMDTGVDDGQHVSLPSSRFIGGYDALAVTPGFTNPDDIVGHGTHVASIALGSAGTGYTMRGVAPNAGLIDVRCIPGTSNQCADALETVYENRSNWNGTGERVDIINMSFRIGYTSDDGTEYFNQLVDLAESMGIVVVAAAGNSHPYVTGMHTPGAATRAITVAGYDDHDNPDTSVATIYANSNQGPRADDGDADQLDELKPEVTAPAQDIDAAQYNTTSGNTEMTGTSMAAPHVSGLVALIIQARPQIANNVASIKDLLITTARKEGTASAPGINPIWNDRWGWGRINAFEALSYATATDLSYPNYPPSPIWASPEITTNPWPPKVGQNAVVTVNIRNNGPNAATNARIHFGVHDYAAATYTFYDIGTQVVNLPVGTTPVSINWVPQSAGHMCLKTEIGYCPDTDYSNNSTQRNINVSNSPVYFQVRNTKTEGPAIIEFHETMTLEGTDSGFYTIDPPYVELGADDCPVDVRIDMELPVDAAPGARMTLDVAAVIEGDTIGGITVYKEMEEDCCVVPGDVNNDGNCNIGDAVYLINHIFKGGPAPVCANAADVNSDCSINIGDAVYIIQYIFRGGALPVCGCVE
ncbi:MAG: S8 family serine peptidase [Candidatus Zixiibacteriota bacterium]